MNQNNFISPTYIGSVKLSDSSGELYVNNEPIGGGGSGNIFNPEEFWADVQRIADDSFTGTFYKEYKICGMDLESLINALNFTTLGGHGQTLKYRITEARTVAICWDIKCVEAAEPTFETAPVEGTFSFEEAAETGDIELIYAFDYPGDYSNICFGTIYLWADVPTE